MIFLHSRTVNNHFNPRSPHGERHIVSVFDVGQTPFQSTLPARGATRTATHKRRRERFQSTLPARGATTTDGDAQAPPRKISIHAPRTGSDHMAQANTIFSIYFNPRSPHGERPPPAGDERGGGMAFQSTLPARGATFLDNCVGTHLSFQSTLPARGATDWRRRWTASASAFQSTLPARGATAVAHGWSHGRKISIHAPRTGSDRTG